MFIDTTVQISEKMNKRNFSVENLPSMELPYRFQHNFLRFFTMGKIENIPFLNHFFLRIGLGIYDKWFYI